MNIADDLDEYLHTLEELADKDEHVNFAQAALLITGSTNVFGKKVESLYELVFATLEATAAATGQPVPAPMRKANNKESDVAQSYVDEFLLLDDVIPVADEDDLALADEQRASDRGLVPQAPLALSGARTEGTTASLAMSTWIPPSSGAEDGDEAFRASQHRENDEQDASYVSAGDDMNMADDNDDYVHGAPSLLPAPCALRADWKNVARSLWTEGSSGRPRPRAIVPGCISPENVPLTSRRIFPLDRSRRKCWKAASDAHPH